MPHLKRLHFFLFFVFLLLAGGALAETIRSINITGNERVEDATIETYLPFQTGDPFESAGIGDVVKTLYATGLFHEVDVRWDQGVVNIQVKENPLVNQIAVEGNENIDFDVIKENLILKPRTVFTAAKAQRDAQLIKDMYRARGRFLTRVKPQIIGRDQNRVDVVYKVEEGEETEISGIRFVGNKRFDDSDLREVVATKETAWWRFLGGNDTYDPNRLEVDKQLLRRHYLQHGYADFQVQSAVAELSRDKKSFYITFTLAEGPRYDFGNVSVQVNAEDENLKQVNLEQELTLKTGELYDASRVEENIETLVEVLGAKGFAFLDVQPEVERHEIERKIDIVFAINPGPRVYVNRINVEGNTRTQDEVVRREMRLAEGDAFSSTKLQRSRDRINRLGYFSEVDIARAETEDPDRLDLTVKVKEQSTGEFNVGAGFSTFEGLLASADVRERNFLGRGQDVSVRFAVSELRQDFNFRFTEPYFLNQELAAGFDLFNEQTNLQSQSSFDLDNTGGAVRFGFPLNEFARNTTRIGFKETKISNVGFAASPLVAREAGKRSSATIASSISLDTRDSTITPTRGYRLTLTGTASGFGSDINYLRGLVQGSWHKEIFDEVIVSVGGRAGAISDLGEDLPIYEHFNAGGNNLRGFDLNGIGPRDRNTRDALGGMFLLGNSLEVSFPMPRLDDFGVRGVLFSDGGIVTEFEGATADVVDSQTYRISVGAGIHWQSPVGPLRIELGVPLVSADEDRTQLFNFSVGSRF
jgi:outer membrane protein insertion porin family